MNKNILNRIVNLKPIYRQLTIFSLTWNEECPKIDFLTFTKNNIKCVFNRNTKQFSFILK